MLGVVLLGLLLACMASAITIVAFDWLGIIDDMAVVVTNSVFEERVRPGSFDRRGRRSWSGGDDRLPREQDRYANRHRGLPRPRACRGRRRARVRVG